MIINAHAHIYPDKIADRAVGGIADFYNIDVRFNGTLSNLLKDAEEAGVSRIIVQSVATVPEQVNSINNFIAEYVKTHAYDAILYRAAGVYFNPALDITKEVVEGLNARYKKPQADKE